MSSATTAITAATPKTTQSRVHSGPRKAVMIASAAAGSTVALTRPTNQACPTASAIARMIMVAAIATAT